MTEEDPTIKSVDVQQFKTSMAPRMKAMQSILVECKRLTKVADTTIQEVFACLPPILVIDLFVSEKREIKLSSCLFKIMIVI